MIEIEKEEKRESVIEMVREKEEKRACDRDREIERK